MAETITVLHYVGYDEDTGGIVSVIRALATESAFECVLGLNRHAQQRRLPALPQLEFSRVSAEEINGAGFLRAFRVAIEVQAWLRQDSRRIFHGHSRAGLLVAWWLKIFGERRAIATVHCLGRQRWFYRLSKRLLGGRLFFLGVAMERYYGVERTDSNAGICLPDCIPVSAILAPPVLPRGAGVVFGCIGAVVPVKQWEIVIAALARIPATKRISVKHTGAEDGSAQSREYARELHDLAHHEEHAGRWLWTEPRGDVGKFLDSIDCLIVASPWEASSMAALEAIAAGVPVIAAAQSGTRELIERCAGGWLFEAGPNAAENLSRVMERLLDGTELSRWRRNEAGLVNFSAAVVAREHARAYASLG